MRPELEGGREWGGGRKKKFYIRLNFIFLIWWGGFSEHLQRREDERCRDTLKREEEKKTNPIWQLCQNRGFISRKLVEQMSPRQDCQASSLHGGVLTGNHLCPSEVPKLANKI